MGVCLRRSGHFRGASPGERNQLLVCKAPSLGAHAARAIAIVFWVASFNPWLLQLAALQGHPVIDAPTHLNMGGRLSHTAHASILNPSVAFRLFGVGLKIEIGRFPVNRLL
jgi:hypothetical protein